MMMFYNYVKSPEAIRNSIRNVPNGISFFGYSRGYISFEIPLSPWDFSPFQNWRWIPQLPRKMSSHAEARHLGELGFLHWVMTFEVHLAKGGHTDYVSRGQKRSSKTPVSKKSQKCWSMNPYLAQSTKNELSKLKMMMLCLLSKYGTRWKNHQWYIIHRIIMDGFYMEKIDILLSIW